MIDVASTDTAVDASDNNDDALSISSTEDVPSSEQPPKRSKSRSTSKVVKTGNKPTGSASKPKKRARSRSGSDNCSTNSNGLTIEKGFLLFFSFRFPFHIFCVF